MIEHQLEPAILGDEILEAYLKYYDTQYWLRDPELLTERRELLTRTGRLLADVILEPVLSYESKIDFQQLSKELGLQELLLPKQLAESKFHIQSSRHRFESQSDLFQSIH